MNYGGSMEKKCKRCGECCKYVGMVIGRAANPDELDWMMYHNIRYEVHSKPGEKDIHIMLIPCKCKFLRKNKSSEKWSCMIYPKAGEEDRRPKNCQINPQFPWQHPPECRFFEKEDDG